jgi:DNA-binding transcriptional LysR family regulator
MYDPLLDTFMAAADTGSFTKAAEKLFISPTAVMKQINTLEERLSLKLLSRTPSGVSLTRSGKIVYDGAVFMKDYSAKTLREAREAESSESKTFCIGTSLLNPAKPFMDLWYSMNSPFRDYKLHLVPFDDDHEDILEVIGQLGDRFDFLIGVCDSKQWLSKCNFLELGTYRKMVAVPPEHRLAKKKKIKVEDLEGETLMMVPQGDSGANDFIRHDLTMNHPGIKIEDTQQFYDMTVFNRCAETGSVLLTIECWKNVHPGLVTIPVDWGYRIPYGLLYSREPSDDVMRFVGAVKKRLAR